MATTPFSSKVLWGASRPRLSLIGGETQLQKLSGTWTWAEGSTTVTVDEDITENVRSGDRIKAFDNGKFWVINTISYAEGTDTTTISLTSAFDESPDLVTNGDFLLWEGDDPDSWTLVTPEPGIGDEVKESTATGQAQILDSTGGQDIGIKQTIFTVNQRYRITMEVIDVTSGTVDIDAGSRAIAYNSTGVKTFDTVPYHTNLIIRSSKSLITDVTVDDVTAIRYSDEAFIDRDSNIWLPHTSDTVFEFTPERNDGGSPFITLESGETIKRHDGFRVNVTLSWRRMDRFDFKKIIQAWNWTHTGQVILIPHEDAVMQFDVLPQGSLSPSSVGDLFDGHAYSVTFQSRQLVKDIPTSEAVGGAHPIVF